MSRMEVIACDGCGKPAPDRYFSLKPAGGWYHVAAQGVGQDWDACGDACLVTVAKMLAGVEVDPLEAMYAAPPAKPVRKRKPTT